MEQKNTSRQLTSVAAQRAENIFEVFEREVIGRQAEFAALMSPTVSMQRFTATAIVAVKNNPALLRCDRRSLHRALTQAAEDGLMPDGREGVITFYKNSDNELIAQWLPMILGIRKRAWELARLIIDAQLVYFNDSFLWRQGDSPMIEHTPPKLGAARGVLIGAYSIFKIGDEVLHREVMDIDDLRRIKGRSKAQKGPWSTDFGEMARKTVAKRGFKTAPRSHVDLDRLMSRDDELHEHSAEPAPRHAITVPSAPPAPPPPPPAVLEGETEPEPEFPIDDGIFDPETFVDALDEEMAVSSDPATLDEIWAGAAPFVNYRISNSEKRRAHDRYDHHLQRLRPT